MSRVEAEARRVELEAENSPDALIAFLTVAHPALASPIRVVSDVFAYEVDGARYEGFPFGFKLLTDGDGLPRTELRIEAVDRRLSQALRGLTGRAEVALDLRSTADFDLSADPRVAVGPATPIYAFRHFTLRDVAGSASEINGTVSLVDYAVEPWPAIRATEGRAPGLFW